MIEQVGDRAAMPREGGVYPDRTLKFGADEGFHVELRRRVDEYFRSTGLPRRDCRQMYVKTAVILACFFGTYVLLVFVARTWWQAVPLSVLLGLSTAAIGFNIQHDGGHGAYSNRAWINRLTAITLDMIGGSSYLWYWKHALFHHTYVNITGYDSDIDLGILGRMSSGQRRLAIHRWQHYYLWPFYGMLAVSWQLFGDFKDIITGRIGNLRFPRPTGWNLAVFIGGKVFFFTVAFVIPLLVHPAWIVLVFYLLTALVVGLVLSVVFQLAHCVEEADFPTPRPGTARMASGWAAHQVQTTVDFARQSRMQAWLLGGLNFQIEHHLFPRICHIHYPAISPIVEATCRDFGVRYRAHPSFGAGVASHFRLLRRMAMRDAAA